MPAGWSAGGVDVRTGRTRFWLNSDRAGEHAVEVALNATCSVSGARRVESGSTATSRFVASEDIGSRRRLTVLDVFDGGCVTTTADLPLYGAVALAREVDDAVSLYPRDRLRAELLDRSGIDIGSEER
jgi:hypothetical protein